MYKELSLSDTTTTQEVLTTNFRSLKTAKLNNSKDLSIIEDRSVNWKELTACVHHAETQEVMVQLGKWPWLKFLLEGKMNIIACTKI